MSKEQNGPVAVYFTFGSQYAREPHPTLGSLAHPDGYARVTAKDYATARSLFWEMTQGAFAFDYMQEPPGHYYPRGLILDIEVKIP